MTSAREKRSTALPSNNFCAWSAPTPKGLHRMGAGWLDNFAWHRLHLDHFEASRTMDKIKTSMISPDKPGSSPLASLTLVCAQDAPAAKANRLVSCSFYATVVIQTWTGLDGLHITTWQRFLMKRWNFVNIHKDLPSGVLLSSSMMQNVSC